jgi:hypothetical protein
VEDAEEKQVPAPRNTRNVEGVSKKVVPAAVFGGLTASGGNSSTYLALLGSAFLLRLSYFIMMLS